MKSFKNTQASNSVTRFIPIQIYRPTTSEHAARVRIQCVGAPYCTATCAEALGIRGHFLTAKMSETVVNGTTAYIHQASKMVMSASNGETSNGVHPNPVSKIAANASNGETSSCFKPCRPSKMDTSESNGDAYSHNISSSLPEQVADLSVSCAQFSSAQV